MNYLFLQKELLSLKQQYPALKIKIAGQSVLGRHLYTAEVGHGAGKLLLCGAFHGMESLTTTLLLRYLECLLQREVLLCRVTFLPMLNPDGVQIQQLGWMHGGRNCRRVWVAGKGDTSRWQANSRGVDLNHNFDAGWQNLRYREMQSGILGPAPTRFGGYFPESEPETRAVCELCRREQFSAAVALHTQGEEIYWDFGEFTPPESLLLAQKMAQASGYTVSHPEGLAVGGGFKDWFLCQFQRVAFTIECGYGVNPLPEESASEIFPKVKKALDVLLEFVATQRLGNQ